MSETVVDMFPEGVSSGGMNTLLVLDTMPTDLADVAAGFDITCYLPIAELEIPWDQATEDDTRGCDAGTRKTWGLVDVTKTEIKYIVNPQGDGTEPGNMAAGRILPNTMQYLLVRMAVKHGTASEPSHKWDVYQMSNGAYGDTPMPGSQKYLRTQKTTLTRIDQGVTFQAAA